MEYILGNNPMGYAYEVGYEYNFASHPHHRSSHCSATQSMDDPIVQVHTLWGALVGGPDLKDFHNDVTKDYIYNEVTDDYNAGICGDLAGLYHFYGAKGKEYEKDNHINPDFDMSKNAKAGFDQIDADGNPLPVGIYAAGGKNQEQEDSVQLKVVIYNRTIDAPRFESDLKARYYFNVKELEDLGYNIDQIYSRIDYDQEKGYSSGKNEAIFTEKPVKYDDKGNYYVEIQWKNCDFYGSRVFQFALGYKMDENTYEKVKWDSKNDYSYEDLVSFEDDNDAAAITDKITLYADGKLIWGVEPDGTTPDTEVSTFKPGTTINVGDSYGDANCDGNVNIADAVLVMQVATNPDKYAQGKSKLSITALGEKNADVDGKKGLSNSDALLIQKYKLGLIKKFPVNS
jgi:hypothetical protein